MYYCNIVVLIYPYISYIYIDIINIKTLDSMFEPGGLRCVGRVVRR